MRDLPSHLAIIGGAAAVAAGVASGWVAGLIVALVGLGVLASTWVGRRIATDVDRRWLSALLPLAFIAKMIGSTARYFVVAEVYGIGDAFGYHRTGLRIAPIWESLQVPEVTGGSFGTQVTGQITGLMYAIVSPPMIGGFLFFGILSFVGMVCFYVAFRSTMPRWGVLPYFVLLFFLPTMAFWPSSVGKDALMVLGLGLVALGTVWMVSGRFVAAIWLAGGGGLLLGLIRPHILAIAVGSIVLTVVFTRAGHLDVGRAARALLMVFAVIAMVYIVPVAAARIGADEGLETFLAEQNRLTSRGGSAVVGEPATTPQAIPEATLRVLFRPLIHEASTPGMFLSGLESVALLGLVIWTLPTMWANRRIVRRTPYMILSLAFTGAFIIAFSAIFNLGILARQRSQVIPFLLVVIIGLGWRKWSAADVARVESSREAMSI
jgi:hypothetical protein